MKDAVRQIIGKTIQSVIISEGNAGPPHDQVFLIFNDDTYYEFYGHIAGAGGVDKGGSESVLSYVEKRGRNKGTVTVF